MCSTVFLPTRSHVADLWSMYPVPQDTKDCRACIFQHVLMCFVAHLPCLVDLWPMYPVPQSTKDCRARMGINTTEMLATPWDDLVKPGLQVQINPCRYRQKPDDDDESQRQQRFCIMYATEPFDVSTTPRQVAIEDRMFPTATDQER